MGFLKNAKKIFYCLRELSLFWFNKYIPYVEWGTSKKSFSRYIKIYHLSFFDFSTFSIGEGYPKLNISIIHQKFSHTSIFVNFSHIILFIIFLVYSTHWQNGQGNWSFLQILLIKNIQSNTQENSIIIFNKSYIIYN